MTIRDLETAKIELKNCLPILRKCVADGIAEYGKLNPVSPQFRINTSASVIRDMIAHQIRSKAVLEKHLNIRPIEKYGTTHFVIGNWIIRVHKIHDDGSIALNQTQLAMSIDANYTPLQTDFLENPTYLYLGYVPNLTNCSNPTIVLVCPNGNEPAWMLELLPEQVIELTHLPIKENTITETPVRTRVKGRLKKTIAINEDADVT